MNNHHLNAKNSFLTRSSLLSLASGLFRFLFCQGWGARVRVRSLHAAAAPHNSRLLRWLSLSWRFFNHLCSFVHFPCFDTPYLVSLWGSLGLQSYRRDTCSQSLPIRRCNGRQTAWNLPMGFLLYEFCNHSHSLFRFFIYCVHFGPTSMGEIMVNTGRTLNTSARLLTLGCRLVSQRLC